MRLLAPAKINLHLRVAPPRADGFHPLMTWMTTIGLFDTLTLTPAASGITMTCSNPSLPCDDRNLVVRAGKLLRQSPDHAVSIHLEKQIPHGGGLGGGSSDAARTLEGLNAFWILGKSVESLSTIAATLGSDIPFFLHGPSSICRGRGEAVHPIAAPSIAKWVVLILPAISMPTPVVYRKFDEMKLGRNEDIQNEPDWNQWAALSSQELLPKLVNDLEPPAFALEPRLTELRDSIEQSVARPVRMSGSGSSLFTLYDHQAAAIQAAELIQDQYPVRAFQIEIAPSPV